MSRDSNSKMTPLRIQILLDNIEAGTSITNACRLAGIGHTTLQHWLNRGRGRHPRLKQRPEDIEFVRRYEEAEAKLEDKLVRVVMKDAETSPRMALAVLRSRFPAWRGQADAVGEGENEIEVVFQRDWKNKGRPVEPPDTGLKAVK